ncbi:hypothetical protein [Pseudoxanthomonas kaohsiungensis]|uniref:RES domain-containing protein n=1 Tax=Pseudoxanthomonas kaohsiungensis TaxID=283923 RepID=A0ABW3M1F5_9GAMM|nr:hypothetical protein [Pseudoxanthomonas kaohsiungensis]KAF1702889.1 hypothetical protein CSC66_08940 [Pseudoxanthomonas kaohsiungensis]
MRLYHGSSRLRDVFAPAPGQRHTLGRTYQVQSLACFFTDEPEFARTFGREVTVVELLPAKTLDLREGAWGFNDPQAYAVLEARFGEEVGMLDPAGLWPMLDEADDVAALQQLGYQVVAFRERDQEGVGHNTFGVLDPALIHVVDFEPSAPAPRY